jgi:hypothetical protein
VDLDGKELRYNLSSGLLQHGFIVYGKSSEAYLKDKIEANRR